jgi:hypothetical protein
MEETPMRRLITTAVAALLVLALVPGGAGAQQIDFPRLSPLATVSQYVGVTQITLQYSSPGVKERQIWGALVPYGEVWRTGANENTTITVSTPVKIEGKDLPAGTYGLQTIPGEGEWTLILSKDADAWGAFEYKPENDALRATVAPRAADHQERMSFRFDELSDTGATVVLHWEKLEVPFHVTADTPALVAEKAKGNLRWQTGLQAATYCLDNDTCLEDAARWLAASRALEETFWNLRAQARLEAKRGDKAAAASWGDKALAAAKAATNPPPAGVVSELEGWMKEWKGM